MRFIKEARSNLLYNLALIAISFVLVVLACIVLSLFGGIIPVLFIALGMILTGCSIIGFMQSIHESKKAFKNQNNYQKVHAVDQITGSPGTGKSTIAGVLFYLSVRAENKKLKRNFYVNECRSYKKSWLQNPIFLEDLAETRYSKEVYDNSEFYPCAWSNVPIKIEGKSVHKFEYDHSIGLKTVPPHSVEHIDESSEIYPTTMHADRVQEWVTDLRFKRQQLKSTYFMEQEATNINKDVRRVIGSRMEMVKREEILQPKLAIFIRDKMIDFGMKHNIQKDWYTSTFDLLGKVIEKVGIVKWTYYMMSGSETAVQIKPEKGTFMAFKDLPIEFDSRSCRNASKTRNLKDKRKPEGFSGLVMAINNKPVKTKKKDD